MLQVLYGYVLALRVHGGDWGGDSASAASIVLAAAPFLGCFPPLTIPDHTTSQHIYSKCWFCINSAGLY